MTGNIEMPKKDYIQEVKDRLKPFIVKWLEVDPAAAPIYLTNHLYTLRPVHELATGLDFDSLDIVEMLMEIEEEFDIELPDKEMETITVAGLIQKLAEHLKHEPVPLKSLLSERLSPTSNWAFFVTITKADEGTKAVITNNEGNVVLDDLVNDFPELEADQSYVYKHGKFYAQVEVLAEKMEIK